jgi:hypothetical protein
MAAYQPIQMPQPNGLDGLAEMVMAARRQSQLESQQRAELALQQQRQDAQITQNYADNQYRAQELGMRRDAHQQQMSAARLEAVQKVNALIDSGHIDAARQIAQAAGLGDITEHHQDPKDALMKPSFEAPAQKPTPPPTMDIDQAGNPAAVQANEAAIKDYETKLAGYRPDSTLFEFGGMRPTREPTYTVAGQQYDPMQGRFADEEARRRRADQARKAFEYSPDYASRAGALAEAPPDIARDMNQQIVSDDRQAAATDRAAAAASARAAQDAIYRDRPQDRMDRTTVSAQAGLEGRGKIAEAMGGGKADQNTLGAAKYIGQKVKDTIRSSGYVKLREADQQLSTADAQLDSGSGSGQFGALMLLGRAMRGGAATEFTSEEERKHLSGLAGRIEGIAQSAINGEYSPDQIASAKREVAAGRALMAQLLDRSGQALAITLREDPMVANLKGTANAEYRAAMTAIGRGDAPPLFPDETNNVPALGANIVKGGGTYAAPQTPKGPPQVNRVSVRGPLGAFRGQPGSPEDVNSEAPLPEDPNADELAPPTKAPPRNPVQEARAAEKAKSASRANTALKKPNITKEQAIEELRKRGLIP